MRWYSNQPHYINFLGKLSQHLCIDTLRFEDFDSHFLTKICAFIPEELFKEGGKKISRNLNKIKNSFQTDNLQISKWPGSNFVSHFQLPGINFPDISSISWYFYAIRQRFKRSLVMPTCSRTRMLFGPTLLLQSIVWRVSTWTKLCRMVPHIDWYLFQNGKQKKSSEDGNYLRL